MDPGENPEEAVFLWEILTQNLCTVLPEYHHEKVIFNDSLAQSYILAGKSKAAAQTYQKAYEQSRIVSGPDHPATQDLKSLATNPPKDKQELLTRYKHK